MDYSSEPTLTVEIHFPYFKQGDLKDFSDMHLAVTEKARKMYDMIPPEARAFVKGYGDTHFCTLTGPESLMRKLVNADLALESSYDDSN